jgi:hypothetical protein
MRWKVAVFSVGAAVLVCASVVSADDRLVPSVYPTIQAAIDAALPGDTVIVAPGVYTGPGNRDLDFGGKAITVRSSDPNDPCVVAATVIDCENSGRGFNFHSGEGPNSVLDGLTVTDGHGHIDPNYHSSWSLGGGIYCANSGPTIRNCTITSNEATQGAGIFAWQESSPTVTNCAITQNRTGGGVYCWYNSTATIAGCLITDNGGRGIYSGFDSASNISNCTISRNSEGIDCTDNGAIISNCTISDNNGSGISIFLQGEIDGVISNCLLYGNDGTMHGFGTGGGIRALAHGDGIIRIDNCTISGNSADQGGGVSCEKGEILITNCILWANTASKGEDIYVYNFPPPPGGDWDEPTKLTVSYSRPGIIFVEEDPVLGDPNLILESGNIDADPCLVDPCNNDYHLSAGSPCINAADPNYVIGTGETDIDGQPRVMGSRLDMGADEFAEDCNKTPDLAPDGNINDEDLKILTQAWLTTPGGEYWNILNDLNCDGVINLADFALLAIDWADGSNGECLPNTLPEYSLWLALGQPLCWCYPRQCHGDADGLRVLMRWVYSNDFTIFRGAYLTGFYNPCADFDRDGDVDDDDAAIIEYWLGKPDVPADCLDPPEASITYQIEDCNMEAGASSVAEHSESTRFTATVEGQYIHFEDMMVANCCPDELELEMTVEGNLITIHEREYTIAGGCRCMCDFPVTATLGPFASGTYTLEVYEDYGGFIGSTTVNIY